MAKMVVAALLWMVAQAASAGLVTLFGTSVNYVYEENQAAVALFGTPQIMGNAISFVPPGYRAESLNGAGGVTADADFIFSSVYSRDGSGLGVVSVFEFGDYEIINAGGVAAELGLTVADNRLAQSAQAGQSFSDNDPGVRLFQLTAGLDLASAFSVATNDISVTISNILTATSSGNAEGAWIQKKLAFAAVTNTGAPVGPNPPAEVVPVPGVLALFGLGMLAMGSVRRRNGPA